MDFSRTVNVVTKKNQKNWPGVYFLGALWNQALLIACGLLATFFGAATLEIVVARVNQLPRLFFGVHLPNIDVGQCDKYFRPLKGEWKKDQTSIAEDHSPRESLTVNW